MTRPIVSFSNVVREHELLAPGDRVVVAVSGGIDSMVLLDLLVRLRETLDLDLSIAHINYGLRGAASDRDEEFVRERAGRCGFPCDVLHARLSNADNIQNEARKVRYDFLKACAKKRGATIIATAHHRDDQAETVLMHLMRGAGLGGLSGMPWCIGLADGVRLIRPLLGTGREEIAAYAKERTVRYVEDTTNAETRYNRNAVRHTLLPVMEEFNPRIRDHLAHMANRLREDEQVLTELADQFCANHLTVRDLGGSGCPREAEVSRMVYAEQQPAIRRRVLMMAFEMVSGSRANLNADQLRRMDDIAHAKRDEGEYLLPGAYRFERSYNRLRILPPA